MILHWHRNYSARIRLIFRKTKLQEGVFR